MWQILCRTQTGSTVLSWTGLCFGILLLRQSQTRPDSVRLVGSLCGICHWMPESLNESVLWSRGVTRAGVLTCRGSFSFVVKFRSCLGPCLSVSLAAWGQPSRHFPPRVFRQLCHGRRGTRFTRRWETGGIFFFGVCECVTAKQVATYHAWCLAVVGGDPVPSTRRL